MGEYAKHNGQEIKIGTCEDMYYLRYDQRHDVQPLSGNVRPVQDREALRFRFPFPDEDAYAPGSCGFHDRGFHRGVTIHAAKAGEGVEHHSLQFRHDHGYLVSLPCPEAGPMSLNGEPLTIHRNGFKGAVQLVAQRYRPGIGLVPVLRCACGAMWRVEERNEIEELVMQIRAEADSYKDDATRAKFFHAIADRVAGGLEVPIYTEDKAEQQRKQLASWGVKNPTRR